MYIYLLYSAAFIQTRVFNKGYISLSYGILLGLKSTLYNHCGEAEITNFDSIFEDMQNV